MNQHSIARVIRAAALATLIVPAMTAQVAANTVCEIDLSTAKPSATVRGSVKSVGFIAGVRWGHGQMELQNGEKRSFKILGAKLLESGAAENEFIGEVYNLKDVADFEGTYYGAGQKISIIKSQGEAVVNNARCVIVKVRATGVGVQLSAPAPGGVEISFSN